MFADSMASLTRVTLDVRILGPLDPFVKSLGKMATKSCHSSCSFPVSIPLTAYCQKPRSHPSPNVTVQSVCVCQLLRFNQRFLLLFATGVISITPPFGSSLALTWSLKPALHKGERGCSLFRPAPNQGAWPTFIDSTPEHDPPLDRAITVCLRVMSLTWQLYCLPVTFLTGYTNCTVDPSVSFRSLGLCGNAEHISIFLSFSKAVG